MAGESMESKGQQQPAEMDMDEMQMAIQALSSLKGNKASTDTNLSSRPRPSEITLPPISTFTNGTPGASSSYTNGHHSAGYQSHRHHASQHVPIGGLQYSYVSAAGGRGGTDTHGHRFDVNGTSSSASTSAYTYSQATTPSGRTATSLSSPGSPVDYDNSAYFGLEHDDHAHFDLPGRSHQGALVRAQAQQSQLQGDDGFIGRVSQFPLVSGALKVYERGRNSSRVVKYGTDLMETSVKTLSKPVINRVVGPNLVGQIDDFACRQLDRFGSRPTPTPEDEFDRSDLRIDAQQPIQYDDATDQNSRHLLPSSIDDGSDCPTPRSSSIPVQSLELQSRPPAEVVQTSRPSRSRWQSLVIEAGVTAGGIGAAVSEESMKSLKYCLHWLHYATAHLDHQVGILREFISSLSSHNRSAALMRSEDARAASILDGIKRDVVETIRKVVDVVSTYAGSALPEQAKRYVRSSILGLPEKWARAMQGQDQAIQDINGSVAGASSGSNQDTTSHLNGITLRNSVTSPTQNAAERTLTFAVESLDMLRGVLGIFTDSVDRADAWVERLRQVGLQRQEAFDTREPASSVQLSAVRSDSGSTATNGVRKRDDDGAESFRHRKNSRKTGLGSEMETEECE